jgi:HK97 family phage portal protein
VSWRERLAAFFPRAATEPAGEAVPLNGAPPPPSVTSGLTTLPPWGNQWPVFGPRFLPENLAVVCACVQAIAGGIASLPASVYQRLPDGKRVERPDHPVARLIRAPNELQSWADFVEWLLASALLQGNAVAVVDHDQRGAPVALYPVPWWACQPILVPAAPAEAMGSPVIPNSKLVFDVTMTMVPWPMPVRPTGFPVRYFADEVLFLRDRSDDGILGRSRLSRCPEALAAGLGAQGFSTGVWHNGAMVGGVVQHPGKLSKEATDNIAQSWRDVHTGPGNAGKLLVLEEGMQYEKIGVSPEDAELLQSRQFSVVELARVYGVPPPIIGDFSSATFASASQASQWFGSLTLLPWINKLEREFSRVVFNDPDFTLGIDLGGLLRGDYAQRMQTNIAAVRSGIMSADEARIDIGLNPRGGDADALMPQAVGGRPQGTQDGEGDQLPQPGALPNGSGRNGAAVQ